MWKLGQRERPGVHSCGNCYKGKGQGFIHVEIITKGKARGSFMWKSLQRERPGVRSYGNCFRGKCQGFIHVEIVTKGNAMGLFMWKLLQKERQGVHSCGNSYEGKGQSSFMWKSLQKESFQLKWSLRVLVLLSELYFIFTEIGFWLNVFNAELSQKRYWWRLRSQEVGEEGDCT